MSIPAFAWAIEQGQLVDEMTTNHLVLLMIMGNEANRFGELVMGQPRLAKLTKLTVRTVEALCGPSAATIAAATIGRASKTMSSVGARSVIKCFSASNSQTRQKLLPHAPTFFPSPLVGEG